MRKGLRFDYGFILPLLLLFLWQYLSTRSTGFLPTPKEVGEGFVYLYSTGRLQGDLKISLTRVLGGFFFASFVGVPLGFSLALVPRIRMGLMPLVQFLRQIPPIAWIPLFLVWFGIGEASKVAVIVYAALFPIVLNTFLGASQIPTQYWEVAQALELSPFKVLTKLVLPAAAPFVFTGLRLAMGMSWRALVAAEMIASSSGLGYLIMASRSLVRLDEMVVGMILIGLVGVLIDRFFVWGERILLPWNHQITGSKGENEHVRGA